MSDNEDWDWLTLRERKTRIVQKNEPRIDSDASVMLGIVIVGLSGALMVIGIIAVVWILVTWLA